VRGFGAERELSLEAVTYMLYWHIALERELPAAEMEWAANLVVLQVIRDLLC
jgi:hypothetical protein